MMQLRRVQNFSEALVDLAALDGCVVVASNYAADVEVDSGDTDSDLDKNISLQTNLLTQQEIYL